MKRALLLPNASESKSDEFAFVRFYQSFIIRIVADIFASFEYHEGLIEFALARVVIVTLSSTPELTRSTALGVILN